MVDQTLVACNPEDPSDTDILLARCRADTITLVSDNLERSKNSNRTRDRGPSDVVG